MKDQHLQKEHQIYTVDQQHNDFNLESGSNSLKVELECNGLISSAPSSSSSANKMNIKLEELTQMSPSDGVILHQQHHRSSVVVGDGTNEEHRLEVNF